MGNMEKTRRKGGNRGKGIEKKGGDREKEKKENGRGIKEEGGGTGKKERGERDREEERGKKVFTVFKRMVRRKGRFPKQQQNQASTNISSPSTRYPQLLSNHTTPSSSPTRP